MTRLGRWKDTDRQFDLEFWRRLGSQARFAASWEMVKEYMALRGIHGRQSRLQRSVERIERAGG